MNRSNLRGLRPLGAAAAVVLALVVLHGCSSSGEAGPVGPPGPQGPQGVQGVQGPQGNVGPAGAVDTTQLAALNAAIATALPTGIILPFAGDPSKVPPGFLLCDGAEVSRTSYARLFDAIGIAHGGGDGTTTFNLPDYRGRFLSGVDGGAGRDPDAASRQAPKPSAVGGGNTGDAVGSVQGAATALPTSSAFTYPDNSGWSVCGTPSSIDCGGTLESGSRSDSTRNVNGGGDRETRPVNAAVLWIIRS